MASVLKHPFKLSFDECKTFCKTSKQKIGMIYSFTSPSGKMYIGQTTSNRFSKRMNAHKNIDHCPAFHRAIKKYGWDTIIEGFKILAFTDDLGTLDELEIKFIKQYDTFKNGYNCNEGGGGNRGLKHSLTSRKKMSEAIKNHYKDNPEARKKLSEATKNQWKDLEARKKLSEANKKRWKNPEARKKITEAIKNHYKDPEARKKLSEAQENHYKDNPERLRKHREMLRKHWKAYNASEAGKQHLKRARQKANAARRKPIIATNLQTGETTHFVSAQDAVKKLSALHKRKFDNSNISACARKKLKTHKGYKFAFVK